jgi:hypothetical protein
MLETALLELLDVSHQLGTGNLVTIQKKHMIMATLLLGKISLLAKIIKLAIHHPGTTLCAISTV